MLLKQPLRWSGGRVKKRGDSEQRVKTENLEACHAQDERIRSLNQRQSKCIAWLRSIDQNFAVENNLLPDIAAREGWASNDRLRYSSDPIQQSCSVMDGEYHPQMR